MYILHLALKTVMCIRQHSSISPHHVIHTSAAIDSALLGLQPFTEKDLKIIDCFFVYEFDKQSNKTLPQALKSLAV